MFEKTLQELRTQNINKLNYSKRPKWMSNFY
jgi:hypothetical protein